MADPLTAALGRLALTSRPSAAAEGGSTHPLVAIFDPLLATRALDGVDLCSLGCVCKGLGDRVRQFWLDAEAAPGMQQRYLRVDEKARGEMTVREVRFLDEDDISFDGGSSDEEAIRPSKVNLFPRESRVHSRTATCDSCGRPHHGPLTFTFPYPFDGDYKFSLCRWCFEDAECGRAPHHSRAERFRIAPCNDLIRLYLTQLPLCMVRNPVAKLRPRTERCRPIFALDQPHASVRRVAAISLAEHTPKELHEHWRREGRLKG